MPALQDRFSVRPYEPDDAEATIDIFLRAIREVASKDYNPAQIAAWAKIDDAENGHNIERAGRPGLRWTVRNPSALPI
ncbi:hypothetical protein FBZ98_103473 [Rhizobium sp. ERR 922]|nr:hypothetical protein FBZ98_103473 [Rhizobium sp. ERR 922]TWB97587.1 hypothetical protein FBZ97_103410 [Rhizobium sp. ERR 942]